MRTLLRDQTTAVWGLLVVATLLSASMGAGHAMADPEVVGSVVITVGFIKARMIGRYFMELRFAPVRLRLAFDGWLLLTWSVLVGLYLAGS
jgi:hypothetical protein